MKRLLLMGIAFAPLLQPTPAKAVVVECANCSDIVTQLWQQAKQAQQYVLELQSRATQLQQYANMVTNTTALPRSLWYQAQSDIYAVRNLANAASLLTGNSGSILTRLQSAQGYANQAMYLPQNVGSQFTMWQQTIGNASNALGRTLGLQQGQEQNIAALQMVMQQHSQTATGQMQAIQAGNELAGLTSAQLNQIQTTLTITAQQQASVDLANADRTAAEDAARLAMLQSQPIPLTGYKGY